MGPPNESARVLMPDHFWGAGPPVLVLAMMPAGHSRMMKGNRFGLWEWIAGPP